MSYCRGCGHEIHETAESCPQCGAPVIRVANLRASALEGTLWLPVPALVCGLIPVLAAFKPDDWTQDEAAGCGLFAVTAIALAGVCLARQKRGIGMAIAGLVLGILGLLFAIGSQV